MKKHPKVVQADSRGQIVIPKEIRQELGIDENTAFFVYSISEEGILLKKIRAPDLSNDDPVVREIREKSDAIKVKKSNVDKSIEQYRKTKDGKLDII
jgi:AbrB family looped-hinge helix DNA binding protein